MVSRSGCLPLNCSDTAFPISVAYDLAGDMTSYSVSGTTFTQIIDTAERVSQISSSWVDAQHPATLWTANATQGFYPHGTVRLATFGNGLSEAVLDNTRLQPCRIDLNSSGTLGALCDDSLQTGNVQHFRLAYGASPTNNGNPLNFVGTGKENFSRTYVYDSLNRIFTMSAPGDACSGLSWTIDAWGNRTQQNNAGGTCNTFSSGVGTNNRLSSPYAYDAAGNLIGDGVHTYTYNAENQLTQVDGGATATYVYDPEGRRVQKVSGSVTTDYLYHPNGNLVADMNASGLVNGYVYQGSRLIAEYENGTTRFIHGDHLGSTRLVTNLDKTIFDFMDYLPFGEQIAGSSATTHKFTGKERDAESGLDNFEARYVSSKMGRFITPDWSSAPHGRPLRRFFRSRNIESLRLRQEQSVEAHRSKWPRRGATP
jgi:RHS repeat-associated protein